MPYDSDIHRRRSIRLRDYDYATAGAYFVTFSVQGRQNLFGEIIDGVMGLYDAGQMVANTWVALSQRFPSLIIDEYAVMPNHFHGILVLQQFVSPVGAPLAAPNPAPGPLNQGAASSAPTMFLTNQGAVTLGNVVRAFKSISAIAVNRNLKQTGRLWQRNYYERVIRDEAELTNARQYIIDNPARWAEDAENPVNHS